MNKILLHEIVMPNYIRKVKLSDKRRTHYLELKGPSIITNRDSNSFNEAIKANLSILITSKPLGKSVQRGIISGEYIFKERVKKKPLCLFDTKTNEFVITNPKVAGTEKWEVINGQKIYNFKYNPFTQGKIMEAIHEFITPFLMGLIRIDKYPLFLECELHDYSSDDISGKGWDVGNRCYPYCKAFDDALTRHRIIIDDKNDYVICPSHPIFYPLEKYPSYMALNGIGYNNIPLLVFKIYHIQDMNTNS